MQQSTMHRVTWVLTVLMGIGLVFTTAVAEPEDLASLTSTPQNYLGKEVEITGFCVKGGAKGDVLGYECTTEGTVYVDALDIEPAAAKEKIDDSCKGEQQDATCRAIIRFVPHSVSTSNVLDPGKTITIFNTKKAALSF